VEPHEDNKMSDKCVLVIGGGYNYYEPFRNFGRFSRNHDLLNEPNKVAMVLFTGGADICPSLYGHKPSNLTWCDPRRDVYELFAYRKTRRHKFPLVGVCRGAQFLCAMAGGTLYQHVSGHNTGNHTIRTWDDRVMHVTSTHHQMQNPPDDARILAWSERRRSNIYIGEDNQELESPNHEIECVYYPNINAVGMQYHPEMMSERELGFKFAEEMVASFLFGQQKAKG
jgi:gamma-glutamyl-gamma-aminobutyrate hydrolase PuuD